MQGGGKALQRHYVENREGITVNSRLFGASGPVTDRESPLGGGAKHVVILCSGRGFAKSRSGVGGMRWGVPVQPYLRGGGRGEVSHA